MATSICNSMQSKAMYIQENVYLLNMKYICCKNSFNLQSFIYERRAAIIIEDLSDHKKFINEKQVICIILIILQNI